MQQKAFMQYSININQLAIVNHNNRFGTNLDIIDGVILEYLQKQSTSTFAKRNFKIVDGAVFYLLCYDNIIQQLPLIKIASKDAICRRIDKLVNANVILKHIEKIPNNGTKIYFTTTEIFESFFSYDTTQKSDGDTTQKSDGDTTQKSNHIEYDNNINDKNINDNRATAGGLVSNVSGVKESLTAQKPKKEKACMEFEEFWISWKELCNKKGSAAGTKNKAELEYKKVLKSVKQCDIMRVLKAYDGFIQETFGNNPHAERWLKYESWGDVEGAINEYKGQEVSVRQKKASEKSTQGTSQKQPIKTAEEIEAERVQVLASIEKKNAAYSRLVKEQQAHSDGFSKYLLTIFSSMHEKWILNCIFIVSGSEKTTLEIQIFNQKNTSLIEKNIDKILSSHRTFKFEVDNIILTQK